MDENPVLVEKREGYRVITLNRPQRLNAFNEPMQQALVAAVAEAETDETCRALLLTGTGRAFSSGQDLSERINAAGEVTVPGEALEKYYNPLVRKLRALPFPVVCAVNGTAAGVSCNIALACDIVLAARSATLPAAVRAARHHSRRRRHLAAAAAGRPGAGARAGAAGRAAVGGKGGGMGPDLEGRSTMRV